MRELVPSRPRRAPERFRAALESATADFNANGGTWRASELLTAASNVPGAGDPQIQAAIDVVQRGQSTSLLSALALEVGTADAASPYPADNSADSEVGVRQQRLLVHELRRRTRRAPRNAFTWVDLARAYFALGEDQKARRSLETALAIDPDNRFVVRSAVRYFVHVDDEDRARAVVLNSNALEVDPWLLSVGVAIGAMGRRATMRLAQSMIEEGRYSPWHLAELSATLATLEYDHGQERAAKRYMRGALIDPTENVLAHAEWASWASHLTSARPRATTQTSAPNEALARRYGKDFEWQSAANYAQLWQHDQPFALDAASLGSFYATEAGDYDLAVEFCNTGLVANPNDRTLLNNRAFASACRWELARAARDLAAIDFRVGDPEDVGCALATAGFVAFRAHDPDLGRSLYLRSIRLFSRRRMVGNAARAAMNLAAEEKRVGAIQAAEAMRRAGNMVRQAHSPAIEATWKRIQADSYLPVETSFNGLAQPSVSHWLYEGLPVQLEGLPNDQESDQTGHR